MPKVIHNTQSKKIRRILNIVAAVGPLTERAFADLLNSDLRDIDLDGDEALLQIRRVLASYIKKGMLERKDLEVEIVVLASLVWFLRQEEDRKMRILEDWG